MAITIKEEQDPYQDKPWSHELDSLKHLTDVHMSFQKYVGKDFKLSKLDGNKMTQKQDFVMDMVPCAIMAWDICPNKRTGEEVYEMIMSHINTLAIINFNLDNNMIVDRVTRWQQRQEDMEPAGEEGTRWQRIKNRMSGKETPRQAED